jgi:hypothetical protein
MRNIYRLQDRNSLELFLQSVHDVVQRAATVVHTLRVQTAHIGCKARAERGTAKVPVNERGGLGGGEAEVEAGALEGCGRQGAVYARV